MNPHKWLFVPLDFSALYVRKPELLRATFSLVPEYLRGDAEQSERNYMDYGIQLGRRFRALKAYMVIRSFGGRGLVSRIREHIRLARMFTSWLEADPLFEVLAPVPMAVVCFRIVPRCGWKRATKEKNLNSLQRHVVESVRKTGEAYLTHTKLNGSIAIRLAVGNVLTTERDLRIVYELIRKEAAGLVTAKD